jgi:glycosyltransferase involved in cell wall biosynthesis
VQTIRSVLQVNTTDIGGGAAAIAFGLHNAYLARGIDAWMAVGAKRSGDPHIFEIPNDESRGVWARAWQSGANTLVPLVGRVRGADRARNMLREIGSPGAAVRRRMGQEDFDFPGSRQLLSRLQSRPDVLHLHNLHGGYFDLRALEPLSRELPTLVTLHDTWLLTGHCAYSLNCRRWEAGCGHCPDLTINPPLPRDGTAGNWSRKRSIYAKSSMVVVSPSKWLAEIAERSILAQGATKILVIPNGIDQQTFRPGDKMLSRETLGIDNSKAVIVFAANGIRQNLYKDFPTIQKAIAELSRTLRGQTFEFIGVGDEGPDEVFENGRITFVPHVDRTRIVDYYRAADLYVHAARADNFPNTVLEALSCGTPVVATAVGGVGEQVRSLRGTPVTAPEYNAASLDEATGILVGPGQGAQLGQALCWLLENPAILERLGRNASSDAAIRFSLERQADDYIELYGEMMAGHPVADMLVAQ